MRRTLYFLSILVISLASLLVIAWAWSRPGQVSVNLGDGTVIEMNLAIAGVFLLLFGGLVTFLVWLFGFLISLPKTLDRQRSRGRASRANDAITQGILAIEGGDTPAAQRFARIGMKHAKNDRLRLLLEARVAEEIGDWRMAEKNWELLTVLSGGQIIGLRGAAKAAEKRGDAVEAKNRLKSALKLKSHSQWPFDILFETQVKDGLWQEALETLEVGEKRGYVTAEVANRQRSVLMTALATSEDQDSLVAQKMLQEAGKLCPGFPVAAWHGAQLLNVVGKPKEAERLLIEAWKSRPHPALSNLFSKIETRKTSEEKKPRADMMIEANPEHRESLILVAEKAINQEQWDKAITILGELAEEKQTTRICLLLAKANTGKRDIDEATQWITIAATAPREPDWSDLDAEGMAFEYDIEDWVRLVYVFGETGELIHPRYERFSGELDVGTISPPPPEDEEKEVQEEKKTEEIAAPVDYPVEEAVKV